MTKPSQDLTHLVYEASLDNSLWPELILELTDHLQRARANLLPDEDDPSLKDLARHFDRAFEISQRMVDLQEQGAQMSAMLDSVSFGMALIGDRGQVLLQNAAMAQSAALGAPDKMPRLAGPGADGSLTLEDWVSVANRAEKPCTVQSRSGGPDMLLLPRREAARMGLPPQAAAVLVAPRAVADDGLRTLADQHGLTERERDLAAALVTTGDLRTAAGSIGLAYESARTYLKRIFDKTGSSSQLDLIAQLTGSPSALLRQRRVTPEEAHKVRRLVELSDGRQLEYFVLGPKDGTPVVHFDALAGVAIDVTGHPKACLAHLERHGVRLITPCRPGGFRSDPKPMHSLTEFAPDVAELMDALGYPRFSVFSVSYGSGSCLAIAHELQDRIDRVVMASPTYPNYRPNNWRDLDQYFQMSSVLGRYWPGLLRQIIPFLVRSVMQNADRYFDRYVARCKCPDDAAILSDGPLRQRMAALLAERTAAGMDGMVEENLLNARGWDFDVSRIGVPVTIVHGMLDNVSPLPAAEALAADLPDCTLVPLEERGHYHHLRNWPWLAAWAANRNVPVSSDLFELPGAAA
ncbi:alpha/beta fold hydrolase [Pseudaestuariivita atlantica]|uniref:alpha/beta fold hydrolase n=1 Tax=Pseudaestuariivita atlantica TaxID=1317121 RepID=UPI00067CF5C1|nr:alpha/beta hydrolase [Pseudaestuariivita atlantica]